MRIFRSSRHDGWLAISDADGQVDLAHVRAGANGRPEVTLCESFRKEGADSDTYSRLRREFGFDRYRCTTSLQFSEYQFLQVEPPDVPAEELKEATRWKIKSLIDYPVDQATLDVLDIPTEGEAAGRSRAMFVVCAPNSVLEQKIQAFQSAKIEIEAIDVPETIQRNVAALFEPTGRGVALLAFGTGGGLLTFTAGGELYASRRLDVTLTQLVEAGAEQRQTLFDRIVLELQRSLDTFDHQHHYVSLAKLLVMPLPAEVNLAAYLAQNLYLPVETADLGAAMDLARVPELKNPARQAQCFHLIGAALRGFEAMK